VLRRPVGSGSRTLGDVHARDVIDWQRDALRVRHTWRLLHDRRGLLSNAWLAAYAHAAPLTGAKKIKKQCCRSSPRCKGCPVLLMRAARLQESGVTGKDLKKALKKARAA